jgi:uncharacterized membrane protein
MLLKIWALLTFGIVAYYTQMFAALLFVCFIVALVKGYDFITPLIWFTVFQTVATTSYFLGRNMYRKGDKQG